FKARTRTCRRGWRPDAPGRRVHARVWRAMALHRIRDTRRRLTAPAVRRGRPCSRFGDGAAPSTCRKCLGSWASWVLPMRTSPGHFGLVDEVWAARPFLAGDSFSLADIPAGTSLYRYFELDIERPTVANVTAWYQRLRERPACRQHVMIPFADLRGRLEP